MTMQEQIAAMQAKRAPMPRVWQDSDGKWRHKYDHDSRFERKADAELDARWSEEWGCK